PTPRAPPRPLHRTAAPHTSIALDCQAAAKRNEILHERKLARTRSRCSRTRCGAPSKMNRREPGHGRRATRDAIQHGSANWQPKAAAGRELAARAALTPAARTRTLLRSPLLDFGGTH